MKELSDCRVLIVDDVRSNVQLLAEALKGEYKVSVALDGESALKVGGGESSPTSSSSTSSCRASTATRC